MRRVCHWLPRAGTVAGPVRPARPWTERCGWRACLACARIAGGESITPRDRAREPSVEERHGPELLVLLTSRHPAEGRTSSRLMCVFSTQANDGWLYGWARCPKGPYSAKLDAADALMGQITGAFPPSLCAVIANRGCPSMACRNDHSALAARRR